MIDKCRSHLCLFNSDYISEVKDEFEIIERDPDGAGRAVFHSASPCIKIRARDKSPLIWSLAQTKCADGAFLSFDRDGNAHLHIVELKSKIKLSTWAHARQQLQGMFLTAVAVARLLGISEFGSITCYIVGSEDRVEDVQHNASPALIKARVGESKTFGGLEEWKNEEVELPFNCSAPLKKAWKDASGVVDFGSISS